MHLIRRFLADTSGATGIEYGLIAGLIAMAIMASIGQTGDSVAAKWNDNARRVQEAILD